MTLMSRIQLSSYDLECARNGAALTAASSVLLYVASVYWLGRSITYASLASRLFFGSVDGAIGVLATDNFNRLINSPYLAKNPKAGFILGTLAAYTFSVIVVMSRLDTSFPYYEALPLSIASKALALLGFIVILSINR